MGSDTGHKSSALIHSRLSRMLRRRWRVLAAAAVLFSILAGQSLYVHLDQDEFWLRGKLRFPPDAAGWERLEVEKAQMAKDSTYQGLTPEQLQRQLPVRVVSLRRAAERRTSIIKSLKNAGVNNFELVDAVDARNASITDEEVKRYIRGVRLRLWQRRQRYHMSKVAVDLSHLKMLERVALENKAAVIMEDDPQFITKNLYTDLLAALKESPQDWQVLFLFSCYSTPGRSIGQHVAVLREGLCTLGYVATPAFARTVLSTVLGDAKRRYSTYIDVYFKILMRAHSVQAYVCQPQLLHAVLWSNATTIEYNAAFDNVSFWEKPFI